MRRHTSDLEADAPSRRGTGACASFSPLCNAYATAFDGPLVFHRPIQLTTPDVHITACRCQIRLRPSVAVELTRQQKPTASTQREAASSLAASRNDRLVGLSFVGLWSSNRPEPQPLVVQAAVASSRVGYPERIVGGVISSRGAAYRDAPSRPRRDSWRHWSWSCFVGCRVWTRVTKNPPCVAALGTS